MVYESDFYTTRRPYTRPMSTNYTVTNPNTTTIQPISPLQQQQVRKLCYQPPYTPLKGLVNVIHTPYPVIYHTHTETAVPIRIYSRVRPSVIAAELQRIRNQTRPSSVSYVSRYLNSKDNILFDDEAREIRARADSLLRRIHVFVPRPSSSDFAEVIVPERMHSDDYIRRVLTARKNAKKDDTPSNWYETPEHRQFGSGHLAAVTYTGGKPVSRRRPFYKLTDLRVGDIQSDVNLLSYYAKNRHAAASAYPDVTANEIELETEKPEHPRRKKESPNSGITHKPHLQTVEESKEIERETKITQKWSKVDLSEPKTNMIDDVKVESTIDNELNSVQVAEQPNMNSDELIVPDEIPMPKPVDAIEKVICENKKDVNDQSSTIEESKVVESEIESSATPITTMLETDEICESKINEDDNIQSDVSCDFKISTEDKIYSDVSCDFTINGENKIVTDVSCDFKINGDNTIESDVPCESEYNHNEINGDEKIDLFEASESTKNNENEINGECTGESDVTNDTKCNVENFHQNETDEQNDDEVLQRKLEEEELRRQVEELKRQAEEEKQRQAEEARLAEERWKAEIEERVRREEEARQLRFKEIEEQEQLEAARQTAEAKKYAERLQEEKLAEEERRAADTEAAIAVEEEERAIIENIAEEARKRQEREEQLVSDIAQDVGEDTAMPESNFDECQCHDTYKSQDLEEKPSSPDADDDTQIEEEADCMSMDNEELNHCYDGEHVGFSSIDNV